MGNKKDARLARQAKRAEKDRTGGAFISATLAEETNGNGVDYAQLFGYVAGAVDHRTGFNLRRFDDGNTDLTLVQRALGRMEELGFVSKGGSGHYNAVIGADSDALAVLKHLVVDGGAYSPRDVARATGVDREMVGLYLDDFVAEGKGPLVELDGKYSHNATYFLSSE